MSLSRASRSSLLAKANEANEALWGREFSLRGVTLLAAVRVGTVMRELEVGGVVPEQRAFVRVQDANWPEGGEPQLRERVSLEGQVWKVMEVYRDDAAGVWELRCGRENQRER